MSTVFQKLIDCSGHFLTELRRVGTEVDEDHGFDWPNHVFHSSKFRRAHLDVVDARESKRLYMMHLCIFPHVDDGSPIYGFDIIAGPNKVTGAFHDFSPVTDCYMLDWFADRVRDLEWSKPRELPEWARNIFSKSMVTAGNINTPEELDRVLDLAKDTLDYYLENVGGTSFYSSEKQDYYCKNQRKNPHTPRVMRSLGFNESTVERFIAECLFPSVSHQA